MEPQLREGEVVFRLEFLFQDVGDVDTVFVDVDGIDVHIGTLQCHGSHFGTFGTSDPQQAFPLLSRLGKQDVPCHGDTSWCE